MATLRWSLGNIIPWAGLLILLILLSPLIDCEIGIEGQIMAPTVPIQDVL